VVRVLKQQAVINALPKDFVMKKRLNVLKTENQKKKRKKMTARAKRKM